MVEPSIRWVTPGRSVLPAQPSRTVKFAFSHTFTAADLTEGHVVFEADDRDGAVHRPRPSPPPEGYSKPRR